MDTLEIDDVAAGLTEAQARRIDETAAAYGLSAEQKAVMVGAEVRANAAGPIVRARIAEAQRRVRAQLTQLQKDDLIRTVMRPVPLWRKNVVRAAMRRITRPARRVAQGRVARRVVRRARPAGAPSRDDPHPIAPDRGAR